MKGLPTYPTGDLCYCPSTHPAQSLNDLFPWNLRTQTSKLPSRYTPTKQQPSKSFCCSISVCVASPLNCTLPGNSSDSVRSSSYTIQPTKTCTGYRMFMFLGSGLCGLLVIDALMVTSASVFSGTIVSKLSAHDTVKALICCLPDWNGSISARTCGHTSKQNTVFHSFEAISEMCTKVHKQRRNPGR